MGSLSNIPDFDAVLKRVLLRVREVSNTVASDLLLPQDKLGIPKLLCLDQNKWIDLARAEYGHRDGTKYAAALADVRAAVTRGTLIVPITATNLAEVAEPRNVERRTRLAKFMVDLSGNRSLVSPDTVLRVEFRRAVELLFLKKPDAAPVPRRKLVRKGMMFAFGKEPSIQTGDPQLDELVERALLEPEVSVLTLVHATDEQAMAQMRAMDEKARLVADRARISRHKRDAQRLVELKNLLMHRGTVATALRQVLAKLTVEEATFFEWLGHRDNVVSFVEAVPTLHVQTTLFLRRAQDPNHAAHRNDLKDLHFWKGVLPYANCVVAEKNWGHIAKTCRLDVKYQTEVLRDIADLPAWLT